MGLAEKLNDAITPLGAGTERPVLPPGSNLPAPLVAVNMVLRPTQFLEQCARRYGDHFSVRFPGSPPVVIVSDPELIRAVFRGDPDLFHAGEANGILRPVVGDHSLLLLDGKPHRRDRKLMTPMFHGDQMRQYGETMLEVTTRYLDALPVGESFAFHEVAQAITLDIILATVFGVADASIPKFRDALTNLLQFGTSSMLMALTVGRNGEVRNTPLDLVLGRFSPTKRFFAARDAVNDLLYSEIRQRRAAGCGERTDVLSLLLQAEFDDGSSMEDVEIRDEMMTLLLAGHETTATTLTWLLRWLREYPGALRDVQREVEALGGGGPVPLDRVVDLSVTMATIKETLRRTPVIPMVGRLLQTDVRIEGLHLPAGTMVAPNIYLTHHRPDLWHDPYRFRPARFLEQRRKPWEFFPFGGGNRTCLGMAFAYYELRIVLSEIVRRTKFRLDPAYRPRLVRRNITFAPSEGLPVIFDQVRPA